MNRRSMFGTLAAVAGLVPTMPAVAGATVQNPNAGLIEACREFCTTIDRYNAIYDGPDSICDDATAWMAGKPLMDRMDELVRSMREATTPAGVVALAQALERDAGHGGYSFDCEGTIPAILLGLVMRSAANLRGAA